MYLHVAIIVFVHTSPRIDKGDVTDRVVRIPLITKRYRGYPIVTNDNGAWFYPRHDYLKQSQG
jgi:hypothetical protein